MIKSGELEQIGLQRITFKEVAKIGGKKIQPGEYAIYTIPNQGCWTIIIHANTSLRSIAGGAYKPF